MHAEPRNKDDISSLQSVSQVASRVPSSLLRSNAVPADSIFLFRGSWSPRSRVIHNGGPSWHSRAAALRQMVVRRGGGELLLYLSLSLDCLILLASFRLPFPAAGFARPVCKHTQSSLDSMLLQVHDMSVKDFIAIKSAAVYQPHTAGRYQKKRFRKAQCPIVERYATQLYMLSLLMSLFCPWHTHLCVCGPPVEQVQSNSPPHQHHSLH